MTCCDSQGLTQQSLYPLTICQFLKAQQASSDGELSIDGKDLKNAHFSFVARIVSIEERSTQVCWCPVPRFPRVFIPLVFCWLLAHVYD